MPNITPAKKAELEGQHGELLVLETKYGDDVAFRVASPEEWSRFVQEQMEVATRAEAAWTLILVCCVFPQREEFVALLKRKPGLRGRFFDQLTDFCGAEKDAVRKKS